LNTFEEIAKTNAEILLYQSKLEKFNKARLKIALVSLIFILLFPMLPGRYGSRWIDAGDYFSGIIFGAIFVSVILPVVYLVIVFKYKQYIKRLVSYKTHLESKV